MYGARSVSRTNRGLEPGKVTTMGEAHDCESSFESAERYGADSTRAPFSRQVNLL